MSRFRQPSRPAVIAAGAVYGDLILAEDHVVRRGLPQLPVDLSGGGVAEDQILPLVKLLFGERAAKEKVRQVILLQVLLRLKVVQPRMGQQKGPPPVSTSA